MPNGRLLSAVYSMVILIVGARDFLPIVIRHAERFDADFCEMMAVPASDLKLKFCAVLGHSKWRKDGNITEENPQPEYRDDSHGNEKVEHNVGSMLVIDNVYRWPFAPALTTYWASWNLVRLLEF